MKEHYAVIHRGPVYELWTADAAGEDKRLLSKTASKADALSLYDALKAAAGWQPGELPREVRP